MQSKGTKKSRPQAAVEGIGTPGHESATGLINIKQAINIFPKPMIFQVFLAWAVVLCYTSP